MKPKGIQTFLTAPLQKKKKEKKDKKEKKSPTHTSLSISFWF